MNVRLADGSRGDHPLLTAQYGNMRRCIRCGLCSPVCPTYRETLLEPESPRGRIAMARAFVEGHLPLTADFWEHEESCLLCEACSAVCPSGVEMKEIGVALRADLGNKALGRRRQRAILRFALRHLFVSLRRFRLAAASASAYQRFGMQAVVRRSGILRALGLARAESFLPQIDRLPLLPHGQVWRPDGPIRYRVGLFVGCIMSTAFAEIDRATARILARNGCLVVAVPEQQCCGALHIHNGELAGAQALARQNVDAFERLDVDAIVTNSAGCGAALKSYGHLLAGDPIYAERAAKMAAKARDATEFLAGIGFRKPSLNRPVTVTYQAPCHLTHAQRIDAAPRALLSAIPGLRLIEMEEADLCCGSAGLYDLTMPAMSDALMRRKVANVLATGAEVVVSANPGCMLQLREGLRQVASAVAVKHIVELLDQAYNLE